MICCRSIDKQITMLSKTDDQTKYDLKKTWKEMHEIHENRRLKENEQ